MMFGDKWVILDGVGKMSFHTLLTAYLLQITGLRLLGGLLLLYIVYKLYIDVIKGSDNDEDIKVDNSNFLKAIWTILLADFTMSLDNVLGVAGAAGDHYGLLVFGLILSIILMATAASLISIPGLYSSGLYFLKVSDSITIFRVNFNPLAATILS